MNKDIEIAYSGYGAQPSDYESADGQLAASLNLICEDGNVKPIPQPEPILQLQSGEKVLFIHTVPGQENYILARTNGTALDIYWLRRGSASLSTDVPSSGTTSGATPSEQTPASGSASDSDTAATSSGATSGASPSYLPDTTAAIFITSITGFKDITAVGNTLVFALGDCLLYFLWKNNAYTALQSRPPFISIDFGMYSKGMLTDSDKFKISSHCSPSWNDYREKAKDEELATLTQAAYGLLLSSVADNVTSKGFFYQPFFVRYAIKLYDGSYLRHSAPILMLPVVAPPFIGYSDNGDVSGSTVKANLSLAVPYFSLNYRILADGLDELANWEDLITSIDVFASAPLYTFDQSKDLELPTTCSEAELYQQVTSDDLSGTTPTAFVGHYCADTTTLPDEDESLNTQASSGSQSQVSTSESDSTQTTTDNTDTSQLDTGGTDTGGTGTGTGTGGTVDPITVTKQYLDHTRALANGACLNIKLHENFYRDIEGVQNFYRIAEIDFKDIKAMTDLEPLELSLTNLGSLLTRPTLPDDYQSHHHLAASSLYTFNSRLNLAGMKIAPADPLPIRSCMQFGGDGRQVCSDPSFTTDTLTTQIKVFTRLNGIKCYAMTSASPSSQAGAWNTPETNFFRYLYYPDASAYKMEITTSNAGGTVGNTYIIELKPHDFLNGAYFFRGIDAMGKSPKPENVPAETGACATSVDIGSKIYTSQVNNPFYFPLLGINTVGSGRVVAISSAAKALSQGQFGAFPLYAFTTEGVWALTTSATGTYEACQPITRDVILDNIPPLQLDSSVLFATDRGIMQLSGSVASCISDVINSAYPFDVLQLPGLDKLHTSLGHAADSCFPTAPLLTFLRGGGMLYDYVHQRILVYNPAYTYAYAFSLKSALWGMCHSKIQSTVNAYPEALAVDSDCRLVDFSKASSQNVAALLVTRPLKFGMANILKTVNTVIQRGYFQKGHVQSVLYGSRDLHNWFVVWSSQDHYLRGFRGTPYKYFRIALLCNLSADESLYGASVQFAPRLINQPR